MIGSYLSILSRRWPLLVVSAALLGPLVFLVLVPSGASYRSEAVVQTSTGLAESVLDQTRPYQELESRLATELEVFGSDVVAERAVAALRADGVDVSGPEELRSIVEVAPRGQSSLLEVVGTDADPDRAQAVTDAYVAAYLEHRAEVERASLEAVLADLTAQQEVAEQDLAAAEAQLRLAQVGGGSVSTAERSLASAQSRYDSVAALVKDVQLRLAVDSGGVALLSPASSPDEPVDAVSPALGALLALAGALAVGFGLAFAVDAWRNPVRTRQEAGALLVGRALVDLPQRGRRRPRWAREVDDLARPTSVTARALRLQLGPLFGQEGRPSSLLVTGTDDDSSAVALVGTTLAAAWGHTGARTVLVLDPVGDWSSAVESPGPDATPLPGGLLPAATRLPDVWTVRATGGQSGSVGLYDLVSPARGLEELSEAFDVVVVAVPAPENAAGVAVGRRADAVLVTCVLGRTSATSLQRLVSVLDERDQAVDGVVLVRRSPGRRGRAAPRRARGVAAAHTWSPAGPVYRPPTTPPERAGAPASGAYAAEGTSER